jgi:hypothetical protein
MKTALLALLLSGCSTTVYGPNGKPQLRTYADATDLHFIGPGTELSAATLNHSTPTKAGANGVVSGITALGAAAAGMR